MKEDLTREIVLGTGVSAVLEGRTVKIKGPKGEVKRVVLHPRILIEIVPGKIILRAVKATKREKTVMGSYESHFQNSAKGVVEPHLYKLKVCSGHFPMSVTVSGTECTIKNFLGEAVPRRVELLAGSDVKVNGTEITVVSCDKEIAGQNAAKIESLCRITNRDRRIFQDGCYIIHKAGKDI